MTQSAPSSTPRSPADTREHFPQLDVLRALAALAVLCFHTLGYLFQSRFPMFQLPYHGLLRDYQAPGAGSFLLLYPFTFGWLGVPLFFVLSGFVIHYAYLKRGDRTFSTAQFYWRRFWRIYPAYFVALCVFMIFPIPGHAVYDPAGHHFNKKQILMHLLLIHNLDWGTFYYINGAFWSLANEMQFYLLYPAVLWLRKRLGMANALGVTILLSVVLRLLLVAKGKLFADSLHTEWLWISTPVTWMDWMLGAYAAELFVAGKSFYPRDRAPVVPIVILVLTLVSTQIRGLDLLLSRNLASLFFVWVVECAIRWSPGRGFWSQRVLVPLGLFSYSIYLWHQPLLIHLGTLARGRGIAFPAGPIGFLLLALCVLAISVPIAALSYYAIELPGQRLGSQLWNRYFRREPGTAVAAAPAPPIE